MKNTLMFIIIAVSVLVLAGCKGTNQETNFIPMQPPASMDDDLDMPDDIIEDTEEPTDTLDDMEDEPVYLGDAITKYVKLSRYGAILNVRSAPTTDEDNVVGFLVHTEAVEVVSIEGEWAKLLYNDEIRYVSAEYLVDFIPPYISPPTPILNN